VKQKPFHNPFGDLKKRLQAEKEAAAKTTPTQPPTRTATPTPTSTSTLSEDELWAREMAGVKRVQPGKSAAAPPPPPPPVKGEFWHPDLEAIDELRALVRGDVPFDLADTDEYIEGRVSGLDPGVARKLRRGEYAVQGHVDLHGLTREEAKQAVDRFLRGARQAGKRCVLVVHGRGTHSRDQVPVLKEALRTWLATARFARHVLAFATARPQDGGGGALYVLLRRAGR
jgi:DNA-nicking Smr family endonuclease